MPFDGASPVVLRFKGGGFLLGIPARDLDDADLDALPDQTMEQGVDEKTGEAKPVKTMTARDFALASGLYEEEPS